MSRTSQIEAALENNMIETWSPEAPVQDRITKFQSNLLSRLEALDEIAEADFDLAA